MDQPPRQGEPSPRPKRRRRRRRHEAPHGRPDAPAEPKPQAPAAALASSHDIRSRPAVVALSGTEVAELKQHFVFLKEYRKPLKLRLNAQEDLLLNGAREPSDRGVCQHLLAKVELSRVTAVIEHMDAPGATRLLQGIVRFSSDVGFLLLYLETVRRSSSQAEAASTLAFGLRQMDFAELSPAQLRRVLDLIVEVFDPATRPEILLGLLASKSFRRALDDSLAALPEAVAGTMTPLRAVHSVVLHGGANAHGPQALRRGVELLLAATPKTLGRQPAVVRERLLRLGLALFDAGDASVRPGLDALLATFRGEPTHYQNLALARVARWLAAGADDEARRLLSELAKDRTAHGQAERWLEALGAPRIGRVALTGKASRGQGDRQGERRPRRFQPGFWLDRQLPVLLVTAQSREESAAFLALADLWKALCLPGVAPVVVAGETSAGLPYLAVPQLGKSLSMRLGDAGELEDAEAIAIAQEACLLLGALAQLGVLLPDASPARFSMDARGRVWLVDLVGATKAEAPVAARAHLEHARALLPQLWRRASSWLLSPALDESIRNAEQITGLARVLVEALPSRG